MSYPLPSFSSSASLKSGLTSGFTLIEMVTVILIMGVMVIGVSSFVIFGTRIFVESSAVDQVLSQSRYGIERMTRELRSAVPNSLRLTTASDGSYQCIELVPIDVSTTYLSAPIAPSVASNQASVINSNKNIISGHWAMIYPLSSNEVYQAITATGKRFSVQSTAVVGDQLNVTFTSVVRFLEASPLKRVYFALQPVSYCFERAVAGQNAQLKRYSAYGYQANQPAPSLMGNGALMAENVTNNLLIEPALTVTPSNLMTNALVHLRPRFSVNGETFNYQHQVQVMNVP